MLCDGRFSFAFCLYVCLFAGLYMLNTVVGGAQKGSCLKSRGKKCGMESRRNTVVGGASKGSGLESRKQKTLGGNWQWGWAVSKDCSPHFPRQKRSLWLQVCNKAALRHHHTRKKPVAHVWYNGGGPCLKDAPHISPDQKENCAYTCAARWHWAIAKNHSPHENTVATGKEAFVHGVSDNANLHPSKTPAAPQNANFCPLSSTAGGGGGIKAG